MIHQVSTEYFRAGWVDEYLDVAMYNTMAMQIRYNKIIITNNIREL